MRANFSTLLAGILCFVMVSTGTAQTTGVRWQNDLQSAMHLARQTRRLVLVHFWAPWCKPCTQLERDVFSQSGLARSLEMRYVAVKVDTDKAPELARRYGVANVPTDVILTGDGQMIARANSPRTWQAYADQLASIASRHAALAHRPTPGQAPRTGSDAAATVPSSPSSPAWSQAVPPVVQNPYASANSPSGPSDRGPQVGTLAAQVPPPANHPYGYLAGGSPRGAASPAWTGHEASASRGGAASVGPPAVVGPAAGPNRAAPRQQQGVSAAPAAAAQGANSAYGPIGNRYSAPRYAAPAASDRPNVPAAQARAYPPGRPTSRATRPPTDQPSPPTTPPAWPSRETAPPTTASPAAPDPRRATAAGPVAPAMQQAAARPQPGRNPQPPAAGKPSHPPLGLDGYCPVTLRTKQQWVPGDRRWGVIHRGRTYLFVSSEAQQQFLANPDEFSPVLSGLDPVAVVDQHQALAGQRRHGVFYGGRVYLFASEASLQRFSENPQRYIQGVRQAMRAEPASVGRR